MHPATTLVSDTDFDSETAVSIFVSNVDRVFSDMRSGTSNCTMRFEFGEGICSMTLKINILAWIFKNLALLNSTLAR